MNWANVNKNLKFQKFFFFLSKKWENREKLDRKSRKLDFLKLRKFKKIEFFEYCYIVLRWTGLMSKIWNFWNFFFFVKKGGKRGKILLKNMKIGIFWRKVRKIGFFEYSYIVLRWTELRSNIQNFRIFFFFLSKNGKKDTFLSWN